jgi:diguanylate cyclase (GGDEF)-like protein/PAS domain S-box-containing protein
MDVHAAAQGGAGAVRVLLVEDNADDALFVRRAFAPLRQRGLELAGVAPRLADALAALARGEVDVVLADLGLPDSTGPDTVSGLVRAAPDTPVVVLTGQPDEALELAVLRCGAQDYLVKGELDPALLARTLRHAIERKRLLIALDRARADLEERVRSRTAELEQANRRLREAEERYRSLVETSPDAIWVRDGERIVFVNRAALALYGARTPAEMVGRPIYDFIAPEFHETVRERVRRLAVPGATVPPQEQVHVRLDGARMQVESRAIAFESGGDRLALVVIRDISERKAQEARIACLHRIHVMLSAINSAIVRIRDRDELLREACRVAVEHGGSPMAWIAVRGEDGEYRLAARAGFDVGLPVGARLETAERSPGAQGVAGRAIRERRTVVENDMAQQPDVGYHRAEALARGLRSTVALPLVVEDRIEGVFVLYGEAPGSFTEEEVTLLEELAADISFALDYSAKAARADYLAYYDPLTGLPNRTLFYDHLGQHLRTRGSEQAMVALVLLDLERFRGVNETLGRKAGDKLLRKVAARLRAAMQSHELPTRVGANTFALVLRGAAHAGELARAVEGLLRTCFDPPFEVNEQELRIAARAGIALFPGDGRDAEQLFRNAEAALAKAKAGAERVGFYAPEMSARAAEALLLETRLRRALERGELVLHYQPRVSLATGRITGYEALLRWQAPGEGLVPPARFIPLLEETGLILEAGRQVLARALGERRAWRARGLALPRVAVNVSPIQLARRDFVREVRAAIEAAGASARDLELEITEDQVMRELEATIGKLRELREMDVEIAVDDFGTGYSSLNYIARLPVTTLKVDRSFIVAMTQGEGGRAIVATIVNLARSLGLRTVAEGVETGEQAALLRALGADDMQGYLFSPPLAPEEFEALLRRHRAGP